MFELRLLSPEAQVETLCDALDALDALSVSVEDADAQTESEQPLFGEPGMPAPRESWDRSVLVALFRQEEAAREAARLLQLQDFFAGSQVVDVRAVPDQDWVRLTQSQFAPVDITPTFWIVPSWHEAPAEARQIMRLDPGLAFGTGTHPTTRMCLRWIAHHAAELGHVLDYGCGSGILAIGAALFGAHPIDAVDIDPAAVESTLANAAANHVTLRAGLPDLVDPPAAAYQTVIANILATPLKVLAPLLCSHLQAGGHLVLAGILERQAEELQQAYAPYVSLQVTDREDGWILMTATAPKPTRA
ncbi:MAG: 50S ribosomal protein L11 methyltransferase [Brachymonas sp.]|uniref:50S ribosomal protein L11 methyltransferase n=1 Tax=unclassified Brachymonas TaxID=2621329 RepID=UPI0035B32D08